MIDIKLESSVIPVRIGKTEFEVSIADDAILARVPKAEEVRKKIEKYAESCKTADQTKQIAIAKNVWRENYDALLGCGSFDKIYSECKSVLILAKMFYPLVEKIEDEINKYKIDDLKNKHLG